MMLDDMMSQEYDFYGVDGNTFKLGTLVLEAIEDESDGYRSYLEDVLEKTDLSGLIFFSNPVARVKIVRTSGSIDGWDLVDVVDGHVWLTVGTDNYDDYYPMCIFRYEPKK